MNINMKNFRSTLVALSFGALVTVLPASATTISLSTSGNPTTIGVGGYDWSFNDGSLATTTIPTAGITLAGGTLASEIGAFSSNGDSGAKATQSEVIDINVLPTINGVTATTAVSFEGTIQESTTGIYSLVFGANGSTGCANTSVSCATTSNGNVINNGQTVSGGYTDLLVNGINYEVATSTQLSPTKPLNYLNGFVGVAVAPEPATYATTGLAAAFLGLFLRRKAKKS